MARKPKPTRETDLWTPYSDSPSGWDSMGGSPGVLAVAFMVLINGGLIVVAIWFMAAMIRLLLGLFS